MTNETTPNEKNPWFTLNHVMYVFEKLNSPTIGAILPMGVISSVYPDMFRGRDFSWNDAALFACGPLVQLIWHLLILWIICRGSYSCSTIFVLKGNKTKHFVGKDVYDLGSFNTKSSFTNLFNPAGWWWWIHYYWYVLVFSEIELNTKNSTKWQLCFRLARFA